MRALPEGLTKENPARSLASLATTPALRQLKETVLQQWQKREAFAELAKHGIKPINLALFHGPPGNGKTLASQWLADKLDAPLYRVRCESLVNAYLGGTSANVGKLMAWLDRHEDSCVVLFDEVEQVFPARSASKGECGREISSAMTVFWQWLDRWEASTLFVLATNLPDALDAALMSRIELQLEFGPPTPDQAKLVISYWAEVLHAYGGDVWGPQLQAQRRWESFRDLFYAVQAAVRKHVAAA